MEAMTINASVERFATSAAGLRGATSSGAHRLDIVAVGINQERGVVGRAIVGSISGRPVVAAACLDALRMEFLDGCMIRRAEGDVGAAIFRILAQIKPQHGFALGSKTCAI